MYESRWAQTLMTCGVLWFMLAIAFAPTNKIYQQGLVLLVWLPTLLVAWSARSVLAQVWHAQRALCLALISLAAWATLSLSWSGQPPSHAKQLLYIVLFVVSLPILANGRPERVVCLLQWGGLGLAVMAAAAIVRFYFIDAHPLMDRLEGLGELAHPILGAYAVGIAGVWMLHWMPREGGIKALWWVALALLGAFVVLTQSRGAAVALLVTVLAMPLWRCNRQTVVISVAGLLGAGIVFWCMQAQMMSRGSSYRPELFMSSIQMIKAHPWLGLGLEAPFGVPALGIMFDHSHNLFTSVAISLGLPGLLLWSIAWFSILVYGWRARASLLGQGLVGMWVFSTVAMQFDAASLLDTPRAEWFITWLPIAVATLLSFKTAQGKACDKISRFP
ncbi:O-antigen ligase family protein [Pseudomonas sp. 7P_10.2_Bac1]|uniref:O-antigen ligase family protein n=1 Tax=Pseudomonas sp. 7P_10.2_Bac1 TaxID=2971614 RepID=UPI0021C66E3C|nr:O-antigen ligase family protein [Pseudomonas sp. 7P_10.2_Bac1]MCU1729503.1 O-antigen ligase family protein [Pseudomonas sp. 7P_10.2_Bac1]